MESFTQIKPNKKLFLRGLEVFEETLRISMFDSYGKERADHRLVTSELCFGVHAGKSFSAFKIESSLSGKYIVVYVWSNCTECIASLWEEGEPSWKIQVFSLKQLRANAKKIKDFLS